MTPSIRYVLLVVLLIALLTGAAEDVFEDTSVGAHASSVVPGDSVSSHSTSSNTEGKEQVGEFSAS